MTGNGTLDTLIQCAISEWHPRIGDPNLIGWSVTASYAALVITIVFLLRRLALPGVSGRNTLLRFWLLMLVLYVALGLNKQLDLQTFLTATGRCVARAGGWYKQRREFQMLLVFAGLAATACVVFISLIAFRSVLWRCLLASLGAGVSLAFVVLRVVSFHHVDTILGTTMLDIKLHVILEMSGILLVFLNAVLLVMMPRGAKAPAQIEAA